MKVVQVSPYDISVFGGVQAHVTHLAGALRQRGHQVLVISPGDPARSSAWIKRVGGALKVPFNDSVAPIALRPAAVRRTRAAIAEFEPDLVHVHEPAVPWVSLTAALKAPQPVVGTFHAWSDRDTAYRLARPIAARAAARLAARIAVSPAAAEYHAAALGIPEGDFRIVPNGVDVTRFADATPIPGIGGESAPTLLFVGRLEERKGLEILIRAFPILKTTRPRLRLLVVGDGPERDRCQNLLPGKLRSDVVFLGRVDDDDLARFYRSCDLFVAPAIGGESFGIVLLEAMAAGATVVASDIPGYRSVVHDKVDGCLVPPGDHKQLADTLDVLLANAALRRAMGKQARINAAAYDWDSVAEAVTDVYDSVRQR